MIGKGRVIGVDIEEVENRAEHERISYLKGSSISSDIVKSISEMIDVGQVVLVILDSDHNMPHVLKEMEIYSAFVTKGSYMIVEDSNVNGHPIMPNWGPGPFEAIQRFLEDGVNDIYEIYNDGKVVLNFTKRKVGYAFFKSIMVIYNNDHVGKHYTGLAKKSRSAKSDDF